MKESGCSAFSNPNQREVSDGSCDETEDTEQYSFFRTGKNWWGLVVGGAIAKPLVGVIVHRTIVDRRGRWQELLRGDRMRWPDCCP